ncbi:MAG: GWxTD domain-containing protein, partial [Candidatus Krumholzibacteria bacterium]|nr:GWxTD domain-containing protein [Candidatus Krumholzibacteria bacterium]
HLLLGVTRVFLKKFEESEGEFSKAFELMRDEERTPYEDISSLLPPDMKELYLTSTTEKKIEWNRKFWAESDPTPSTEINERRIEHYKRVFLANALLTNKRLGLKGEETHRGKALIRYGLPHKKYFDLASGLVGPWLIWRYEFPHLAFNLYFQDEFLNGNFHIPIKEKILGKKTAQLMENIPQNYEFPIKYKLLPICVKSAQTRCIGEKTRLEFSIGITNSILKSEKGDWDLFLTFFDQDWNRISNDHFMFRPDTLLNIDKLGERFAVINFWLELLPRPIGCVCVLEIIHDSSKYKGVCRYPLEIRNLFGRSLKLSSIKFTVPDIDGTCSNVLDPIPVYGNFETLCLSYQIYNLKRDENNLSRYRLTYIIKNPEDREEENTGIRKTLS